MNRRKEQKVLFSLLSQETSSIEESNDKTRTSWPYTRVYDAHKVSTVQMVYGQLLLNKDCKQHKLFLDIVKINFMNDIFYAYKFFPKLHWATKMTGQKGVCFFQLIMIPEGSLMTKQKTIFLDQI